MSSPRRVFCYHPELKPPIPLDDLFHVATTGNDSNAGTAASPWLTIQKAANTLTAGQTVQIHAGTYRERVDPQHAGTAGNLITYKAAPGETVNVKGSERVTTWSDQGGGKWSYTVASSSFGSFNPYSTTVSGSFLNYGSSYHLGGVYLEGVPYTEVLTEGALTSEGKWWCSVGGGNTTIKAHFGSNNPNSGLSEINVRAHWFAPSTQFLDYISIQGIHFNHAATQWAPPVNISDTTPQDGGMLPNGGGHWTIKRCWFEDSKCVGLILGDVPEPGLRNDIALDGNHLVQDCTFRRCGEAGIAGAHGAVNSVIERCLLEDIHPEDLFGGVELAAIKLQTAIDVIIRGCVIRNLGAATAGNFGIWLDWQAQNTRITGCIIYDAASSPIWLEANHGPVLIDNNVLHATGATQLGGLASEMTVLAHNFFVRTFWQNGGSDGRTPAYFDAHTVDEAGTASIADKNNKYYNNIHWLSDSRAVNSGIGEAADYSVVWQGSIGSGDGGHSVSAAHDAAVTVSDLSNGVTVAFTGTTAPVTIACPRITTAFLGTASLTGLSVENPNGSALTIDTDILGAPRDSTPTAGPFESLVSGANSFSLYAGADAP